MSAPSLFYVSSLHSTPHSIPRQPNQRPINVDYFQAQHPSRANQPRTFTSDSIQALVRPTTMETLCCKPPPWGKREKNVCSFRIICSRHCTRRILSFHVEHCQHADQKQLTRTIGLRSRHRSNPRPTRFVSGKAGECK